MPGKREYRLVTQPATNNMDGKGKSPNDTPVAMTQLPKRTPSNVAQDILSDSVYKHRGEDEKKKKERQKKIILLCVVVAAVLVILIVVITVAVTQSNRSTRSPPATVGVTFAPRLEHTSSSIHFTVGDRATFQPYVDSLITSLEKYNMSYQSGAPYVDCSDNGNDTSAKGSGVCKFDISTLGTQCVPGKQQFGYAAGNPCVLLKLHPPEGWAPKGPPGIVLRPEPDSVDINCSLTDDTTKVTKTPSTGFPAVYFPAGDQSEYLAPLVMMQFTKVPRNVTINVNCSVSDTNIADSQQHLFQTQFELRIDEF